MKTFICPRCGKEFTSHKSRTYCSRDCVVKHGEHSSRLFKIWKGIKQRCKEEELYKEVGMCEEWKDYLSFRDWALANGYADNLEIDREKNHLGYTPENCRWVTKIQQRRNVGRKSKNKYKGVMPTPSGKWLVSSWMGGNHKYLGIFEDQDKAAEVYDDYVFSIDPEHAYLNFPERLRKTENALHS